ncbi:MAG TPA: Flp family type IVb pilin [Thermomicrobiales bacterium]|nr:Flp family type IVb pilin [Thermomicrobiales bacterium]
MVQVYVEMIRALMTREDEGQGLVEYALIIALVSITAVIALGALSGGINNAFTTIVAAL